MSARPGGPVQDDFDRWLEHELDRSLAAVTREPAPRRPPTRLRPRGRTTETVVARGTGAAVVRPRRTLPTACPATARGTTGRVIAAARAPRTLPDRAPPPGADTRGDGRERRGGGGP